MPLTEGGPVLSLSPYEYVHAYMMWIDIVNSPKEFRINGWQSCPSHLAAEVRWIIFNDDFDNVHELWPDSAQLIANQPSFDSESLRRLSSAGRWVAERLDSAIDQWPTPIREHEYYSPTRRLTDVHDEKAFWGTARANWDFSRSPSQLSIGDLAVFEIVHAIASGTCDPIETSGRLGTLLASRHAPRGRERALNTDVARRAVVEFNSIHEAVVIGQAEEVAAADITGVSRNLLGTTPFWVSGAWRPGLVGLLDVLSS
ncbi:hypothetical protein B7495_18155 (plasmid) [Cryobacterium sp. LW097]|nr:hypothetical protein B7495_18155 [Cryobacterium sp. LW097]